MNIKTRIWSLPAISALIFGLGLAVSSYFSSHALDAIERTGAVDYPVLSQAGVLRAEVQEVAEGFKNAVLEGDKTRLPVLDGAAAKLAEKFKQFGAIPGQGAHATQLQQAFNDYFGQAKTASRIMLQLDKGDQGPAIARMQAALTLLSGDLDKTIAAGKTQFSAGIAASTDRVRLVLVISIAVAVVVLLALALVSFIVVRAIWQQLGGEPEYARRIAQAVAAGDLSVTITLDARHPDSLLAALAEMKIRLAGIVSGIQGAAEEIRLASGEIASGNTDLSARTESQANNIGNAAQSMTEMTSSVQKNAQSARHATELASAASDVAERGGYAVSQVVETMSDISSSSRKIADIIGVIDGIAFQTNILALNAAVEAARAGEQGRGFAVVASEVRNLAHRSASAAKEIKDLIAESAGKVSAGSALVADAGRTMQEIVTSVRQVTDLIKTISLSSQTQSAGLEELSRSVNEMDESTQRNAAMTEQAAAAAGSLQEQAMQLSQTVGVFKLPDTAGVAPAGAARLRLR